MQPLSFDSYRANNGDPALSFGNLSRDIKANLPISSLFILFVIIGGNFMSPLFPCRLQGILEKNMLAKHLLGFFTLLLFVELSNDTSVMSQGGSEALRWRTVLSRTIILYVWFVFTTTMEPSVFLVLIGLLAALFVLKMYIHEIDQRANPDDMRLVIKLRQIEGWLYYTSIVVTVFGVVAYYGRKKGELGRSFNLARFFIGNAKCKGTIPPHGNLWKHFLMAF